MANYNSKEIERQAFNSRNNYQQQLRGIKELKQLPDYQQDKKHNAYQQMSLLNRTKFESQPSALGLNNIPAQLSTVDKLNLINNGSEPHAKHGIVNDVFALPRVDKDGEITYDLIMDASKSDGGYFDRNEAFSTANHGVKGDEYLGHPIDKGDLDFMLQANGKAPLPLAEVVKAAKAGRPLINPSDQIVFNQTFDHGCAKTQYHHHNDTVLEDTNPYQRPSEVSPDNPVGNIEPPYIQDVAPHDGKLSRYYVKLSPEEKQADFTAFCDQHLADLQQQKYTQANLDEQFHIDRVNVHPDNPSLALRAKYQAQQHPQVYDENPSINALKQQNHDQQTIIDSTQPNAVQGYVQKIWLAPIQDTDGKIRAKDGQVPLGIFMQAYDPSVKKSVAENVRLNRPHQNDVVQISRQDLAHILDQNNLPDISAHDAVESYQNNQPIVNNEDGLKFGFAFTPTDVNQTDLNVKASALNTTPNKVTPQQLARNINSLSQPLTLNTTPKQEQSIHGYINSATVVQKNGQYFVAVDAKRRRDIDPYNNQAGDSFVNQTLGDGSVKHTQVMSVEQFNRILRANNRPEFTNDNLGQAYRHQQPLVNATDNVGFCCGVKTTGKVSDLGQPEYRIDTAHLAGEKFDYAHNEAPLEAQSKMSQQWLEQVRRKHPDQAKHIKNDGRYGFGQYQPLQMKDMMKVARETDRRSHWEKFTEGLNRTGLAVGAGYEATRSYLRHAPEVIDRVKTWGRTAKMRAKELPKEAKNITQACHDWLANHSRQYGAEVPAPQKQVQNAAEDVARSQEIAPQLTQLAQKLNPSRLLNKTSTLADTSVRRATLAPTSGRKVNMAQANKLDEIRFNKQPKNQTELREHERDVADKLELVNDDNNLSEPARQRRGLAANSQAKNAAQTLAHQSRDNTLEKLSRGLDQNNDKARKELYVKSIETGTIKDTQSEQPQRVYFAEFAQRGDVNGQQKDAGKNVTTAKMNDIAGNEFPVKLQQLTPHAVDKIYALNHQVNPLSDDKTLAKVAQSEQQSGRMVQIASANDNLVVNAPVIKDFDLQSQKVAKDVDGNDATRVVTSQLQAGQNERDFNYQKDELPVEQQVAKDNAPESHPEKKLANDVHELP